MVYYANGGGDAVVGHEILGGGMAGHRGSDRQQPPIWQLRPLPYRLIGEQTGVSLWRIRDCIRLSYRS